MNRLQKIIARLAGIKADSGKVYSTRDAELAAYFGAPTYAGKTVTEQTAMQITAVWGCVRVLAETAGGLPVAVYEKDKSGNAHKVDHDLSRLFVSAPNADMSRVEFVESIVANIALGGNGYSMIERNGPGMVTSLYPFPGKVQPKRKDDGTIYYRMEDRGKWEDVPREKVWHVKGFGTNGLVGLSPIGYARQALGMALAAEEFQARFFGQGANPSWLISFPTWLTREQRATARENVRNLWQGTDNAHTAAILEGGMTATPATMPLEDAQFLQLRGFTIQEICRLYRVPPHMVMDLSRSTNNNIEHQGTEFVMFSAAPYLTRIEAAFSRWLLPPGERERFFLRFNVDGLMRATAAVRAAFYASAIQNGWLSRNEVRALENRNRVELEGMDSYTAQSNLLPVDALADDARRNAGGAPKPPAVEAEPPDDGQEDEGVEAAAKRLLEQLMASPGK